MKNLKNRLMIAAGLSTMFVLALAGQSDGQKIDELVAANVVPAAVSSTDKETQRLGRVPFQKTVTVEVNGLGSKVVAMQIPAGKRLVIENVTAIVRSLESQPLELDYSTYTNAGNGVAQMSVHRLALQKQGSFKDSAIFGANEKVTVYADEKIGDEHFSVGVSARFNGSAAGFVQAQFTFSGYLEDLPAVR